MKLAFGKAEKLMLAVALAWAIAVYVVSPLYMPMLDSATYADIAKNLAAGRGFLLGESPTDTAPLLPALLSVFMTIAGQVWIPAYLAFSAFLMVVSLFYLAEDFKKGSGIIAVLVTPTLALPVLLSLQVLTDVLFLVFVNAGVLLLRRFLRQPTYKGGILSASVVCLSYLLRPTGLFLIAFAFIACLWHTFRGKMGVSFILPLVLMAVIAFGYWEVYKVASGFETTAAYRMGMASGPQAKIAFALEDDYNGDLAFAANVPIQAGNFLRLILFILIFATPTMLVPFALFARKWLQKGKGTAYDHMFLLLWLAVFLIPHVTVVPSMVARYMLPVIPVFIIAFSGFLLNLWRSKGFRVLGVEINAKTLIAFVIVFHLAFSFAAYRWYYPRTEHLTSEVFSDAGVWIASLPQNATFSSESIGAGDFHYQSGRTLQRGDTDYIILTDSANSTVGGYNVCKRFEDKFHSLEVLGKMC